MPPLETRSDTAVSGPTSTGSKKAAWFFLLIVIALVAVAVYGYSQKQQAEPKKKNAAPVPVVVAQVSQQLMPVMLDVVGRTEPYETVTVKSRVDGQLAQLFFNEGQVVKPGDILARLDSNDFDARVKQAEATLARDQVLLAKAKADLERYTALVKQGFVSEEKLNEYRTNESAVAATIKADQAALELARLQASYTVIRAPIQGVIGSKLAYPGATIKINDTALAVINRVQPLFATFTLPEQHVGRVRELLGRGRLTVEARLPGGTKQTGQVKFMDNTVDSTSGTILLKAVLPNADQSLAAGQFIQLSLQLDEVPDALVVPNEAIQQGPEGNFVYVLDAERKASIRKIEVLTSRQGMTAVKKGLSVGETVVTTGQLRLFPGAQAVLKAPKKEPGPGATPTTPTPPEPRR
ncbi:efflux RND transporter periplasmic adaptor subunit [Parvibium lacunae]|uniref:Efflux RND transporter periplasmic adaptor subunit n=1 Tax=Parvibium lacunae TaxID=1888893 RepID=A0A368L4Q6_9BURK|nr:efflux RND transporter periplasmic adaptor subunit [Parvibium lacunae]RCS58559.1 efflux RND transporter periplasmic adaptor subunit [Parvibium lacunae]